jgi:hypothetical protein
MPDANHYLHQAKAILSLALGTSNPIAAAKLQEIAEEYLARAVKLRVDRGPAAGSAICCLVGPPAWRGLSILNPSHSRLLRAHRKRPSYRAAHKRDEFTTL